MQIASVCNRMQTPSTIGLDNTEEYDELALRPAGTHVNGHGVPYMEQLHHAFYYFFCDDVVLLSRCPIIYVWRKFWYVLLLERN